VLRGSLVVVEAEIDDLVLAVARRREAASVDELRLELSRPRLRPRVVVLPFEPTEWSIPISSMRSV